MLERYLQITSKLTTSVVAFPIPFSVLQAYTPPSPSVTSRRVKLLSLDKMTVELPNFLQAMYGVGLPVALHQRVTFWRSAADTVMFLEIPSIMAESENKKHPVFHHVRKGNSGRICSVYNFCFLFVAVRFRSSYNDSLK